MSMHKKPQTSIVEAALRAHGLDHCIGVPSQLADSFCQGLAYQATAMEVLQNDLNTALRMLADWCVAVDVNGTGWDDWDEHYKDAMYREGPLRSQLDAAIAEARMRRG